MSATIIILPVVPRPEVVREGAHRAAIEEAIGFAGPPPRTRPLLVTRSCARCRGNKMVTWDLLDDFERKFHGRGSVFPCPSCVGLPSRVKRED